MYGPDAAALRWRGLGEVGLELPIAVGTRPLSALSGSALVVAGSLLRGSRSACQGLPGHSIVEPRRYLCPWVFAGVLFESFNPVAWYATPLTKNDLRKFRSSIGESEHNTAWEALSPLVARYAGLGTSGLIHGQRSEAWCSSPVRGPQRYCPGAGLGRRLGLVHSGAHDSHPQCIQQTA